MRRATLALLIACGLFAWMPGFASHARAEDGEPAAARARPTFLAKLTAEELKFVQTRIKDWDKLGTDKQQRIARNIVRMRKMTDKEKQRMREHVERMRRHKDAGHKSRARGRFHDHATRALIGKALARAARESLGPDFERQLRQRDISDVAFEHSYGWSFWRGVSEARAATGAPPAPDALPATFPQRWRSEYAKGHARWARTAEGSKERSRAASRLHLKLAWAQADGLVQAVRSKDLQGEAYVEAIAADMRRAWPEAYEASVKDPEALIRSADKYELRRAVKRLLMRTERIDSSEAAVLVGLLNRLAVHHRKKTGDEASRLASDELLKQVLVRELKVSEAQAAKLPPASEPEARMDFFKQLASKHGQRMLHMMQSRRGHDGGAGKGRRPFGLAKLPQPKGVSDADWAIYVKARDAAFAAMPKDGGKALQSLRGTPPEGMSPEGHAAVMQALKAHMKRAGGRGKGPRRRGDGGRGEGGRGGR